jgi:hypothetical protein
MFAALPFAGEDRRVRVNISGGHRVAVARDVALVTVAARDAIIVARAWVPLRAGAAGKPKMPSWLGELSSIAPN